MRNFLGVSEFKIGQFVAYPTRQGSSLNMNVGIVIGNFNPINLHILVPRLRWLTDSTTEYDHEFQKNQNAEIIFKKVHVNIDRIVIINESYIPTKLYDLLIEEKNKL